MRVGEAADAAQGAEVVVEGAVLLHQEHDVLDVAMEPVRLLAGTASALLRSMGSAAPNAGVLEVNFRNSCVGRSCPSERLLESCCSEEIEAAADQGDVQLTRLERSMIEQTWITAREQSDERGGPSAPRRSPRTRTLRLLTHGTGDGGCSQPVNRSRLPASARGSFSEGGFLTATNRFRSGSKEVK